MTELVVEIDEGIARKSFAAEFTGYNCRLIFDVFVGKVLPNLFSASVRCHLSNLVKYKTIKRVHHHSNFSFKANF
jgi:hypothetical protein